MVGHSPLVSSARAPRDQPTRHVLPPGVDGILKVDDNSIDPATQRLADTIRPVGGHEQNCSMERHVCYILEHSCQRG
jgi:hypothetical protein